MSLYSVAVFLHIVGALGLFAALGLEWAGLQNLRRSVTTDHAREWMKQLTGLRLVERPSTLALLVTGIYMAAVTGGHRPWIGLGLVGLVVIAALGGLLTNRRLRTVGRVLPKEDGPVAAALARQLADPILRLSASLRTTLALGIVFIMSTKPDRVGVLSALGIALALGLAAGLPAVIRRPRAQGA
jgi:hypothetical protein